MLIDATALDGSEHATDLCIIGTGPAALTLARTIGVNRDMWLLEAGDLETNQASQHLYRGRNLGLPYFDLDGCRSRQFGGSSNCWGGFCRVFDRHDFDLRPSIPLSGWPMTWDDLRPQFEAAHALCGLGPLDYSYGTWAEKSGQGPSPFTGPYVQPEVRQKASFDVAAIRRALDASIHARVCLNATVTELVSSDDGTHVTGVRVIGRAGRRLTLRARIVVLAAGGIENARLLLVSRRVHQHGIGNDRDMVGRCFMEHIDFETGVFTPLRREAFTRQLVWRQAGGVEIRNSLAIAEGVRRTQHLLRCFFHIGEQTVDHTWGYRSAEHILRELGHGRTVHNFRYHWRNLVWDRRPLLAATKWRLHFTRTIPNASGRPGVWPLRVTAEPSPNPNSRVMLAAERDRLGMPRVALDWRINAMDYAHAQRSIELFAHDVTALGLGRVAVEPPEKWAVRGTYHHMGTTRMSTDPTWGVVDEHARVHGMENLYVAGSSIFPTAGSGTPTLMIIALSLRLATHLAGRLAELPLPAGGGRRGLEGNGVDRIA